ncbi:hypothetical protein D3C71_1996930 [compost metagenome]
MRLHIECLEGSRIMRNEHWFVIGFSNCSFMRCAEIIAPGNFMAIFIQELNRIIIRNPRERCFDVLQFGNIAAHRLKLSAAVG